MRIFKTILSILAAATLLLSAAEAEFLFPVAQPTGEEATPGMTARRYGDQAMADGLYENAVRYFTEYRDATAQTLPAAADACIRLAGACNAANKPEQTLQAITAYLGTEGRQTSEAQLEQLTLLKGTALYALRRYDEAASELQALLVLPPQNSRRYPALRLVSDAHAAQGQWPKVIALLAPALADYSADEARGRMLRQILARAYMAQGNFGEAKATLAPLLPPLPEQGAQGVIPPASLSSMLLQLQCLGGAGDTAAALKLYRAMAASIPEEPSPEWHTALRPLAELCTKSKEIEPSVAEEVGTATARMATTFQEKLDDNQLLAEAMVANSHAEAAIVLLERTRKENPDAPELPNVTLRLAELKKQTGKHRAAAELLMELARNEKLPSELRYRSAMQAADAMKAVGDPEHAMGDYRVAVKTAASDSDAARALKMAAEMAEAAKRPDAALELLVELADKYSTKVPEAANARLEAGRLLLFAEKNAEALAQFQRFVSEHPDSENVWNARLAILNLRRKLLPQDDQEAMLKLCDEFVAFASTCPAAHLATQGYFDACQCAIAANNLQRSIEILDELLKRFPDGEHASLALHRNIMFSLRLNRIDAAIALTRQFLKRFPEHKSAAEVALHCGDSLAAQGKWSEAKEFYDFIVPERFGAEMANEAAFESIHCQLKMGETDAATEALRKMLAPESKGYSTVLLARAAMLYGDILSTKSDTAAAREMYATARNYAGDSTLGYAALARQAEVLLAANASSSEELQKVQNCLQPILAHPESLPPELRERARYLAALCASRMGDAALALTIFQELVTEYTSDRMNGVHHSPRYYALSVWEMVPLLEKQKNREELRRAAHILENYAATGLPRSDEAAIRAATIRDKYHLGKR